MNTFAERTDTFLPTYRPDPTFFFLETFDANASCVLNGIARKIYSHRDPTNQSFNSTKENNKHPKKDQRVKRNLSLDLVKNCIKRQLFFDIVL